MDSLIVKIDMLDVLDKLGLCVFRVIDVNGHSGPSLRVEEVK